MHFLPQTLQERSSSSSPALFSLILVVVSLLQSAAFCGAVAVAVPFVVPGGVMIQVIRFGNDHQAPTVNVGYGRPIKKRTGYLLPYYYYFISLK